MRFVYSLPIIAIVVGAVINGCSAPPETLLAYCDSNAFLPDPWCRDVDAGKDAESDAGTDAESDAGTDGSSAIDDVGFESSVIPTCETECVPEAEGPFADGWSDPRVVWFGPSSELDAHQCPDGVLYEKMERFDKLVAPPAKCDACACLPSGSCNGLPDTIEIRSGTCNASNVQTTPFDGPPNWDGSCTSVNAMAAGQLCNGVPCAQSVGASTLPAPTNESCTPTVEKPNATLDKHEWLEGVRVCGAKDLPGTCAVTPERCVGPLDDGWLRCVSHPGKQDACPDNYNDFAPRFVYLDNPIDDRGCSACECGTPKDGVCIASLRLYSNALCSSELNNNLLSSIKPVCVDLAVPGLALGSKTISDFSYVPATCSVTGGEPIGTVIPNDDENSVTTICCRSSELPPLPPIR
ncbi:MAG TPA: hypothetical protein PK156_44425 [Polyangium sp.]|nr:hypothetical protein [Polyangium sp.]